MSALHQGQSIHGHRRAREFQRLTQIYGATVVISSGTGFYWLLGSPSDYGRDW